MTDLSERASASMTDAPVDKQLKRDLTKGKLDNLKSLHKDQIEDKTEHDKRIEGFQSKLDDLDRVIKLKRQDETLLEK